VNIPQESVVWTGSSSQKSSAGFYLLCAVVALILIVASTFTMALTLVAVLLPVGAAFWRWLTIRSTVYTLTDQRLKTRRGVFSRVIDDIELYRVKDSHFTQSFGQRLLGIGDITLRTTDASTPLILLPGLAEPEPRWEQIRALVEARRDAKGVREIDMNREAAPPPA
jgi:uncharacterized membrane protein YdbT with pleckstrin-like domain